MRMLEHTKEKLNIAHLSSDVGTLHFFLFLSLLLLLIYMDNGQWPNVGAFLPPLPGCEVLKDNDPGNASL